MVTVIMQHEVKDFAKWKVAYADDETNRAKASINQLGHYRSAENPNDVTMILEARSAVAMEAFTSNPRLQKVMKEAGVISVPNISVLDKV